MFEAQVISFIIAISFMVVISFIRSNNSLVIILLSSAFSLFTTVMYLVLDAPDVAMTEAAVGALISVFSIYALRAVYTAPYEFTESFNPLLFIILLSFATLLIYASLDLPEFGSQFAISQQKTAVYYIENTPSDINIPSIVAAILASYRGYDTLLETLVVLIGGLSVLLVTEQSTPTQVSHDLLITKLTRFMFPIIFIFALYLQIHGEISPGGGFQAGAIIAIAFILYAMSFGDETLLKLLSLKKLKNIAVSGVGLYFIAGLYGLLDGLEFLNYNAFSNNKELSQKIGIITVELGVGITVSATMLLIYFCLALSNHASNQPKL